MAPTEVASTTPDQPTFEAARLIEERMSGPVHVLTFVVEDPEGDIWGPPALRAFAMMTQQLRESSLASRLWRYQSSLYQQSFLGVLSPSDLVIERARRGLEESDGGERDRVSTLSFDTLSDTRLKTLGQQVAHRVHQSPSQLMIPSGQSEVREERHYTPALVLNILTDIKKIGGGGARTLNRADPPEERFAREVLALMQAHSQHLKIYGVALDVNLSTAEQGERSGRYIAAALLLTLALLATGLRSYWVVTFIGLGLATLMIWLKGASNFIGFKSDPVLSLIVPIAMISFGVDAGAYSICRYREEGRPERTRAHAARLALSGTLGALTLAALTDLSAFSVNLLSPLESVRQFGLACCIALTSSFLLLGVLCPLALARIESPSPAWPRGRLARIGRWSGIALSALGSTAVVMSVTFIDIDLGLLLYGLFLILGVFAPLWLMRARSARDAPPLSPPREEQALRLGAVYTGIAHAVYHHPKAIIVLALTIWCAAIPLALSVRVEFDIRHLLSPSSTLVSGLDILDHHLTGRGGEPSAIYIEGPLARDHAREALVKATRDIRDINDASLAKLTNGETRLDAGLIDLWESEVQTQALLSREQQGFDDVTLSPQLIRRWLREGVRSPAEGGVTVRWAPDEVQTMLWMDEDRGDDGEPWLSTRFEIQLAQTSSSLGIRAAEDHLAPHIDELERSLRRLHPNAQVTLTGGAVSRQAELDAIGDSMLASIPAALLLCLLIVGVSLRSLYKAFACVITLSIVVTLLFACMYVLDYGVNFMSATLGALAIGVGVDYATHMTARIDEERQRGKITQQTLTSALSGTGRALLIAAGSSVLGFSALGLAPMPLFAAYGRFTALMIICSLVASIILLPALLYLPEYQEAEP